MRILMMLAIFGCIASSAHAQSYQCIGDDGKAYASTRPCDEAKRSEAVANCVRDVERRGAPQDIKGEMIGACQSAGSSHAVSADASRECVRAIERTGASEQEKARQIAICYGATVEPRHYRRQRPQ